MQCKKENRFTLIEVLIALAVTGIAAMGIFRLQLIGMEAAMHSEHATAAAVLAESQIEKVIAEARAESEPPQAASGVFEPEDMPLNFRWQLDISEAGEEILFVDTLELRYVWRLRFRATWEVGGSESSFELERYVWDYDLEQ